MRGTAREFFISQTPDRFIPAHAGNRIKDTYGSDSGPVHPRACGEQLLSVWVTLYHSGSSPRMRGTEENMADANNKDRFIPAHAGNSQHRGTTWTKQPVHPRACGEQVYLLPTNTPDHGSSPRMRGTGLLDFLEVALQRFIPAHAGNRSCRWHPRTSRSVHPRACGEQYKRS